MQDILAGRNNKTLVKIPHHKFIFSYYKQQYGMNIIFSLPFLTI